MLVLCFKVKIIFLVVDPFLASNKNYLKKKILMIKSFIFFFFSSFSFTSSSSDCDHSLCSLQIPLFSWIRENKGYIHDDLILSNGFNILKPLRGLYSINNIEDDKVLIEIPSKRSYDL